MYALNFACIPIWHSSYSAVGSSDEDELLQQALLMSLGNEKKRGISALSSPNLKNPKRVYVHFFFLSC